jgi:hypothetical protein
MTAPPTTSLWPLRYFVGRVDDDIGAELDRSLEGGERKVLSTTTDRRLGVMRSGGEATDVGDAEQWIARRLDPEQARLASSDLLRSRAAT